MARRLFAIALALLASAAAPSAAAPSDAAQGAGAQGAAAQGAGEPRARQVLLWIRAGALAPGEIDPRPDVAPRLHGMVWRGLSAVEIARGPADAVDARSLAARVVGPSIRALIQSERRGSVVEVEAPVEAEEPADGMPEGQAPGMLEGQSRWTHPVVALLEKRYGAPPPPSAIEEEAVYRIRFAIGDVRVAPPALPEAQAPLAPALATPALAAAAPAAPVPPAPAPPVPTPAAPGLAGGSIPAPIGNALGALAAGAPLAIVLEQVADPAAATERDALLGSAADGAWRLGAVVLVLSAASPAEGAPPGAQRPYTLTAAGPGIRAGRVLGAARPLASVTATVLELLGVARPPEVQGEVIRVLGK